MQHYINSIFFMYIIQVLLRTMQHEKAEWEKAEAEMQRLLALQKVPVHVGQIPCSVPVPSGSCGSPVVIPDTLPLPNITPGSTPTSGRCAHGWRHKALEPPSFDDQPENATKDKLLKWKKKNTAMWWYEKLLSEEAESYREQENARVKHTQDIQHQNIIDASQGISKVYEHITDLLKTRFKENSCQR